MVFLKGHREAGSGGVCGGKLKTGSVAGATLTAAASQTGNGTAGPRAAEGAVGALAFHTAEEPTRRLQLVLGVRGFPVSLALRPQIQPITDCIVLYIYY